MLLCHLHVVTICYIVLRLRTGYYIVMKYSHCRYKVTSKGYKGVPLLLVTFSYVLNISVLECHHVVTRYRLNMYLRCML